CLDEKLTRTTRGTGLGLFIAKGLVEAMDGHIWLESPPSGGFKVSFTMPMTAHIPSPPATTTGIHAQEARL
ncbi:MAG: ATP-binding protein, partial [Cyanobacteria bacterium HKST-UBA06]|nr:ATP-binding protein [Cyanobacteria bacterium HKST-UBA06]